MELDRHVVFAAGNYYNASKVSTLVQLDGRKLFYVHGQRWIKSKHKFSSNGLIHCVGEGEPEKIDSPPE